MLRSFALHDDHLGGIRVGAFSYDTETHRFAMSIDHGISLDALPLSLERFAFRGTYDLSHEETLTWIRGRICPPGRHNIREILKDNGLEEYDEFGLLMVTKGKCDKDELYLAETT